MTIVTTPENKQKLAETNQISLAEIEELTKLTDLSRIKWVGATFDRILYLLGIDSVAEAAAESPATLHRKINQINREKGFYKGKIGENDIRIFVECP